MKRKREDEDTNSYFPYKLRCTQDLKNDFMKGYDNFENGETFLHVAIRSKEYDKVKKFIVLEIYIFISTSQNIDFSRRLKAANIQLLKSDILSLGLLAILFS